MAAVRKRQRRIHDVLRVEVCIDRFRLGELGRTARHIEQRQAPVGADDAEAAVAIVDVGLGRLQQVGRDLPPLLQHLVDRADHGAADGHGRARADRRRGGTCNIRAAAVLAEPHFCRRNAEAFARPAAETSSHDPARSSRTPMPSRMVPSPGNDSAAPSRGIAPACSRKNETPMPRSFPSRSAALRRLAKILVAARGQRILQDRREIAAVEHGADRRLVRHRRRPRSGCGGEASSHRCR